MNPQPTPTLLPFLRKFKGIMPWILWGSLLLSLGGWLWQFKPFFIPVLQSFGISVS